jgi:hypothetical protein
MQLSPLTPGTLVIEVKDRLTGEQLTMSYEDFKPELELRIPRYKAVNNTTYVYAGVVKEVEIPKVLTASEPELKSGDDELSPAELWAMLQTRITEVGGYLKLKKEEKAVYQSLKDQFKK